AAGTGGLLPGTAGGVQGTEVLAAGSRLAPHRLPAGGQDRAWPAPRPCLRRGLRPVGPVVSVAFGWLSPVFFDELDINGSLHNSRFAVHVERAQSALFERLGKGWTQPEARDPDLRYVVRELHMEFLAPFGAPGELLIELSAGHLGRTSAT